MEQLRRSDFLRSRGRGGLWGEGERRGGREVGEGRRKERAGAGEEGEKERRGKEGEREERMYQLKNDVEIDNPTRVTYRSCSSI